MDCRSETHTANHAIKKVSCQPKHEPDQEEERWFEVDLNMCKLVMVWNKPYVVKESMQWDCARDFPLGHLLGERRNMKPPKSTVQTWEQGLCQGYSVSRSASGALHRSWVSVRVSAAPYYFVGGISLQWLCLIIRILVHILLWYDQKSCCHLVSLWNDAINHVFLGIPKWFCTSVIQCHFWKKISFLLNYLINKMKSPRTQFYESNIFSWFKVPGYHLLSLLPYWKIHIYAWELLQFLNIGQNWGSAHLMAAWAFLH